MASTQRSLGLVIGWLVITSCNVTFADTGWELSPYRVHMALAVDSSARPQPALAAELAGSLTERVDAVIGPLWQLELQFAEDAAARRQCFEPQAIPAEQLPADLAAFDKLMWLGVRATPTGYELRCREYDAYTQRWGSVHHRTVQQRAYLDEAAFGIVKTTFAPLAAIRPIADNDAQVELIFKGSGLPRLAGNDPFIAPGDAYQPLFRRTDRQGNLLAGGVFPVSWTFLTTAAPKDNVWRADVYTGLRRAFGIQRGRTEQVAIALRNPPGPAKVRFHARADKQQGLAGYEVFRQARDGSTALVGVTDRDGTITVPPGDEPVHMLLLRSEGQLLAKAPAPNGAGETLEAPIADNLSRLRAQAEAQVLREELVDVVARRAIMMGRVRALLKENRIEEARDLMTELDSLPSTSVFSRTIDSALKRVPPNDDPSVQRAIDKMFSSTREMLLKFLTSRPIVDLHNEVNAAAR